MGSSRTGFDDVERFGEGCSYDRFPRMLIHGIARKLDFITRGEQPARVSNRSVGKMVLYLSERERKAIGLPGIWLLYSGFDTSTIPAGR